MAAETTIGTVSLGLALASEDFLKEIDKIAEKSADKLGKSLNGEAPRLDTSKIKVDISDLEKSFDALSDNIKQSLSDNQLGSGLLRGLRSDITTMTEEVKGLSNTFSKAIDDGLMEGLKNTSKLANKTLSNIRLPKLKAEYDTESLKGMADNLAQQLDLADSRARSAKGEIAQAEQRLEQAKQSWIDLASSTGRTGNPLEGFDSSTFQTDIDMATNKFLQLDSVAQNLSIKLQTVTREIQKINDRMASMPNPLAGMQSGRAIEMDFGIKSMLSSARASLGSFFSSVRDGAKSAFSNLGASIQRMGTQAVTQFRAMRAETKKTTKEVGRLNTGFRGLAKAGLWAMGIRSAYMLVRRAVNSVTENLKFMGQQSVSTANTLNGLSQSFNTMSGSIASAVAPLINALAPALEWVAQKATQAFNALAMFFGALTGQKSVMIAVGSSKQFVGGLGGIADGAKEATQANEELQRSLAGFDEIEILESPKAPTNGGSGGASPSGGGGGGVGGPIYQEVEIGGGAFEWVERFKTALQPTIDALKRLNTALEPFKTFVATGVRDFYERFLVPVGKWTLGEGIPRFIDAISVMVSTINWPKLNESLRGLWDALTPFAINVGEGLLWFWENVLTPLGSWTMNNVVPAFLTILTNALDVINATIEAVTPGLTWLWDEFLQPIASWVGGGIVIVLTDIGTALTTISTWITNNQPIVEAIGIVVASFATAWGLVNVAIGAWNIVAGIATGVTTALGAAIKFLTSPIGIVIAIIGAVIAVGVLLYKNWDEISAWLKETWETIKKNSTEIWGSIKDFFIRTWESIKTTATNVWSAISKFFTDTWNAIKTTATNIWNGIKTFFSNTWTGIRTTATNVWNSIKTFFSNTWNGIKTTASTIWGAITRTFTSATDSLKNSFTGVFDSIKTVWKNIKKVFNGIIDFVKGVFTGDWKKAWKGIQDIFGGIWDGMKALFKAPINWIIDGINSFIKGINKIKIPDWVPLVGGKGFNIGTIPRLAKGGIIDQPTVAMVGEAGKEAVMPLENNTGWITELAGKLADRGGTGGGDTYVSVYLDSGTLIDTIRIKAQEREQQLNQPLWG